MRSFLHHCDFSNGEAKLRNVKSRDTQATFGQRTDAVFAGAPPPMTITS